MVTDKLGAQGTVSIAGGRYDDLVEQWAANPTPSGVKAPSGIERSILMLETLEQIPEEIARQVDVYLSHFR